MKSSPQKGLSAEARDLWQSITAEYEMDAAGLALLKEACLSLDRLRQAQDVLKVHGITTKDRFGQIRQHPATLIERDCRNALVKCLKALNLDINPEAAVGAPIARI